MLKECMEVFESELQKYGEALILDSYIPADGTYILVNQDGTCEEPVSVKIDKKTKAIDRSSRFFSEICFYDYYSRLISMNKPIDGKKIIHSNNYLAFSVKKESLLSGKLTEEILDNYYETLKDPLENKYKKSKEAAGIYCAFEKKEGEADREEIEKNKRWIKEHIYRMENVEMDTKDYLKIFFRAEKALYRREGTRYFLPNIYNSNEYNIEIEKEIYGLPDNNLGMNAKKPFLSIKSRKYPAPYLLNNTQVLNQKLFFDYLMNLVSAGKYQVYIDTEKKKITGCRNGEAPIRMESGYYLRIRKGKTEAEIIEQDCISGYRQELPRAFDFRNILQRERKEHERYRDSYRRYQNRLAIGNLINEVFFSKCLEANYTIDPGDIAIREGALKQNILFARNTIFNWVFKGMDTGLSECIDKASLNAIKEELRKGYKERALWQFNLRWSLREYLKKEEKITMGERISEVKREIEERVLQKKDLPIETKEAYYYAVGQMVAYLLSLSKAKEVTQSLLNPFLNVKSDEWIKRKLLHLYKKYNYRINEKDMRVKKLLALIMGYVPEGAVDQEILLLGYACDNVIYSKKEEN